mgnify:CR=1 FL=1
MADLKVLADIRIYSVEDRKTVTGILVMNGYCVSQIKKQREGTKNAVDYYLRVREDPDGLQTTR